MDTKIVNSVGIYCQLWKHVRKNTFLNRHWQNSLNLYSCSFQAHTKLMARDNFSIEQTVSTALMHMKGLDQLTDD